MSLGHGLLGRRAGDRRAGDRRAGATPDSPSQSSEDPQPTAPLRMLALVLIAALLVSAVLVLPISVAAWLVLGGAALVLAAAFPLVGLALLPLAGAFGSLFALNLHGLRVGPTDLLVAAIALGWLVRMLREGAVAGRLQSLRDGTGSGVSARAWLQAGIADLWRRDRWGTILVAALMAYLAVIGLSAAVATNLTLTLKELVKWSEVLVVLSLGVWRVCGVRQIRVVVWGSIAAGVAEALLGYAQWTLAAGAAGPGGDSIRVFGTFDQPNPYSGFLNFALLLALALALFGDDLRERSVASGATALLVGAQVLAYSRGGLLGLAAALALLLVVGWRRERLAGWTLLVGAPLLALALVTHVIPTRLQASLLRQFRLDDVAVGGHITAANYSTMERLAHWIAGLRMFQAHPLLGVGAGNYNAAYAQYALAEWPDPLGHAHNYYINVAAETGTIGLLIFLALTVAMLAVAWRATHPAAPLRDQPTTPQLRDANAVAARALALGCAAAIVALTVHNLTDDLFVHAIELQVALCLACLLRLRALLTPTTTTA